MFSYIYVILLIKILLFLFACLHGSGTYSIYTKYLRHLKTKAIASSDFSHILITFANILDPDQDRQNVGPV